MSSDDWNAPKKSTYFWNDSLSISSTEVDQHWIHWTENKCTALVFAREKSWACTYLITSALITWRGCCWVKLAEIPDSSGDDCLGNLPLIPGCTPWQTWNSPSGFGPKQQSANTEESQAGLHGNISNCLFHIFILIISTTSGPPEAIIRPTWRFD